VAVPEQVALFAPAIVVPAEKPEPMRTWQARPPKKAPADASIELEVAGATVRIASGTDTGTIAAVIQALKTLL
jgi:transposase